jgi:hypothetical protein
VSGGTGEVNPGARPAGYADQDSAKSAAVNGLEAPGEVVLGQADDAGQAVEIEIRPVVAVDVVVRAAQLREQPDWCLAAGRAHTCQRMLAGADAPWTWTPVVAEIRAARTGRSASHG